ncbi:transposase [Mangrovibacterium sp.]|uniref:transposase n=1 Tax=Mangrovibacterium sp. TaxID=1961364 RepID=UPI003567B493
MYFTEPTDTQHDVILAILKDKRKRNYSLRKIFNATFYVLKTSCQWRMIPKCFPKWKLLYYAPCSLRQMSDGSNGKKTIFKSGSHHKLVPVVRKSPLFYLPVRLCQIPYRNKTIINLINTTAVIVIVRISFNRN